MDKASALKSEFFLEADNPNQAVKEEQHPINSQIHCECFRLTESHDRCRGILIIHCPEAAKTANLFQEILFFCFSKHQ